MTDASERTIPFLPVCGRIAGRAANGLFLSQFVYWTTHYKTDDGWIFKTQAEWEEETTLTVNEQNTARRELKRLGVLEERRAGVPARLYYRLDRDRLAELIRQDQAERERRLACGRCEEASDAE